MKRSYHLYLVVLGMWFALTCFVDFIAVPNVFREVSSRAEAGNIGMILFSLVNKLELFFAIVLIACAYCFRTFVKQKKLLMVTLVSLLVLVSIYNLYMTPQVTKQTMIMRNHEEGSVAYQEAQERHHFFHSLYRKTDGAKILVLLLLIGAGIRKREVGELT